MVNSDISTVCNRTATTDFIDKNAFALTKQCKRRNDIVIYFGAKLLWILFLTDCRNSKRIAQQTPHVVIEGTVMRLHALEKRSYPSFTFSNEQNNNSIGWWGARGEFPGLSMGQFFFPVSWQLVNIANSIGFPQIQYYETLHRAHVQCLHSTEPCRKYPKLPIRASIKIGRCNCSCHLKTLNNLIVADLALLRHGPEPLRVICTVLWPQSNVI